MSLRVATIAVLSFVLAAPPATGAAAPLLQTRIAATPISIRYRPGSEGAVAEVSRAAAQAAPELARVFGLDSLPPLLLQLERGAGEFESATGGYAPDWGAALAFPAQRLAIFDLAACARHPRGLPADVRPRRRARLRGRQVHPRVRQHLPDAREEPLRAALRF